MMLSALLRLLAVLDTTAFLERELPARDGDELELRVEIAAAISLVTDEPQERRQLARLARHESTLRRDVATCAVVGPEGEVSPWQLLLRPGEDRDRICSHLEAAAELALERVRESVAACRHLPPEERLSVYARGRCDSAVGRRLSRRRYAP